MTKCPSCDKGLIACTKCNGSGSTGTLAPSKCTRCNGVGKIKCPNCGGKGQV